MKSHAKSNPYFWFSIFAFSFILFQIISYKIRPEYAGENETVKYFLGVAPNFFPAIGIPALIYAILRLNNSKLSLFANKNAFLISVSVGVTGLVVWEFMQLFSKKLAFDWHDIIWTIAGSIVFLLLGINEKVEQ